MSAATGNPAVTTTTTPPARLLAAGRGGRGGRRGLSLVEAMISLAIAASLLSAVGAAFHASAMSIEANDRNARGTQAARVTLLNILSEVRIGIVDGDATKTDEMSVIVTDPNDPTITLRARTFKRVGSELRMFTDDDPTDDVNGTPGSYALCRNVTALKFHKQVIPDENDNNTDLTARVVVTLTVDPDTNGDGVGDGHPITLTGSATPRKSLRY
jgi:hypothetical protein